MDASTTAHHLGVLVQNERQLTSISHQRNYLLIWIAPWSEDARNLLSTIQGSEALREVKDRLDLTFIYIDERKGAGGQPSPFEQLIQKEKIDRFPYVRAYDRQGAKAGRFLTGPISEEALCEYIHEHYIRLPARREAAAADSPSNS